MAEASAFHFLVSHSFNTRVQISRVLTPYPLLTPPTAVSVESIGAIPPDTIFLKSIEILQDKCATVLANLDSLIAE